MEWWSLLKRENGDRIEWSPGEGLNVRAKRKDDTCWRYGESKLAQYALGIGEGLLRCKDWHLTESVAVPVKKTVAQAAELAA